MRRLVVVLLGALLFAGPARAAAETPPKLTPDLLDAVVRLRVQVPAEARTAPYLGTEREGSGVLIDSAGLIVTIGYLVTEAMAVEVTPAGGKPVAASVVGLDNESGFGLVRAQQPLKAKPLALGRSADLAEKQPVLVASFGGLDSAQPALVVSRRPFAGYWEYLLDDAIFTSPPHGNWGGAALIGADGRLLGVGSLSVHDALPGMPGNMFVPIDRLKPALADLMTLGRPGTPPRPWLGLTAHETDEGLIVMRVSPEGPAQKAGVGSGDVITAIAGERVTDLASLWRKLWSLGPAGVEAPLSLRHGGEAREVTVKTIDRYSYLKLGTTY
jgi:S1-C subfamily serine protease